MADFSNPYDDAILPDDFDPNAESYDLGAEDESNSDDPFSTTEEAVETDAQQEPAEPVAEEPTTAPEAQPPVAPPTIKVRFNHEDRDLSYDEAAMYAQKGMNYDKLEERVKGYETLYGKMGRLAKDLEYDSPEEMIEAAANNFKERQVRKLVEAGNTEAMARFLVDQQMKEANAASAQTAPPTQEAPSSAPRPFITPERKAELDEFIRAYPGVTKLPDDVIVANRNGVRLLVAYERHLNAAKDKELAILKQNQAAAAKAPVTGTTGKAAPAAGKDESNDPFLMGFNRDY